MSAAVFPIEMLASLEGGPNGPVRGLGRDEAGAWYLVEEREDGSLRGLSGAVTPEIAEAKALAVMAGDARALTKYDTVTTMAVFITALMFIARRDGAAAAANGGGAQPAGMEIYQPAGALSPNSPGDDAVCSASGAPFFPDPPPGTQPPEATDTPDGALGGDLFAAADGRPA